MDEQDEDQSHESVNIVYVYIDVCFYLNLEKQYSHETCVLLRVVASVPCPINRPSVAMHVY